MQQLFSTSETFSQKNHMRRQLGFTILASFIITLLLSQRHSGFMLVFVLLVLLPSFAFSAYRCVKFPEERKLRGLKALLWCLAIIVIVAAHPPMYLSANRYAQSVVDKVETYMSTHGVCPSKLEDLGISEPEFKQHLGLGAYACENQQPTLFYKSTYVPADIEDYDFTRHEWRHIYD